MGMFDNLFVNKNKLPLSDEEKNLIDDDYPWQTKDFDCELTEVFITDDGELEINRWDLEETPKEERPYPNDDGFFGLFGMFKRVNERLEKIPFHGYIKFYSVIGDNRYQFYAKFTDGKLVEIDGGKN